jgi:hypothetical protein
MKRRLKIAQREIPLAKPAENERIKLKRPEAWLRRSRLPALDFIAAIELCLGERGPLKSDYDR